MVIGHWFNCRGQKICGAVSFRTKDKKQITDEHFLNFSGHFQGKQPCLALGYHGYQFGQYNPYLGDGRGFLYGQVRGIDGQLYDFGTKGSGQTPHSQSRDGRLTLKDCDRPDLIKQLLDHVIQYYRPLA